MALLKLARATRWTVGEQVQPGDVRWDDEGAGPVFYEATQASSNSNPPSAAWQSATGVAADVLLVAGPEQTWTGRDTVYDILDSTEPTYLISQAGRSGTFRLLVGDPGTRSSVLLMLTSGEACVLVNDRPTSDIDYCTTSSGLPLVDCPAWIADSVVEEFVADDDGNDEYVFLQVEWRQVTARGPAVLP